MRAVKDVVHIEAPCERCGKPATRMGLAAVQPDGRIGEPLDACAQPFVCNGCMDGERHAERKAYRAELDRRKWAKGTPHKTKLTGKQ
jgi:hypothetical protein